MVNPSRSREAILSALPPRTRHRLGRIKRAVLDRPEPELSPAAPPAASDPPPGYDRLGLRREQIFAQKPRDCSLLEIGPAHNGSVARRDGFDTRNVDYLDRDGLVRKYASFPQYDAADIEEVDYVLQAGSKFSESIDDHFDIVVASHVLEHSISLVDFINDLAAMLKPSGHIALVVPDHRFCFDRLRERSSLGSVIDAVGTTRFTHTPGTLIEFTLNAVRRNGSGSWPPGHRGPYRRAHDLEQAKANARRAEGPDYIDVHHWIFSPHHLRLLLSDLADLGYVDVRESHFHPTVGHEFFINLSPDGPGTGMAREELMKLADDERRGLDEVHVDGD